MSNSTSWLTVTAGASGSGNGTVSYSVGGQREHESADGHDDGRWPDLTVTQAGAACTYAIAPTRPIATSAGGGTVDRNRADGVQLDGH